MKPSGPPKRKTRLAQQSKTTVAQRPTRAAIVANAKARDGHCALAVLGGCGPRSDPHEILRRTALKGSHLDPRFVVMVCDRHHAIDDNDPLRAERLGIRFPRWVWDQYGDWALLEAHRLRSDPTAEHDPFWRL